MSKALQAWNIFARIIFFVFYSTFAAYFLLLFPKKRTTKMPILIKVSRFEKKVSFTSWITIRYGNMCLYSYLYLFHRMEINRFFYILCQHIFSYEWVYNVIILIIIMWINVLRSLVSSTRNINSDQHENELSWIELNW